MRKSTRFEIQIEAPTERRGWRAIGGREGKLYITEDERIDTLVRTVEQAREAIRRIRADWDLNWMKHRNLRIVQVDVITTYTVIE